MAGLRPSEVDDMVQVLKTIGDQGTTIFVLIKDIFDTIRKIADQGITVLMVEQDVKHSLSLSDRGYVLEHGRVAMEGKARLPD